MKMTENTTDFNNKQMVEWLKKTAKALDDILNDAEEVFAVAGVHYDEVDQVYNDLLHTQQMIELLYSNK